MKQTILMAAFLLLLCFTPGLQGQDATEKSDESNLFQLLPTADQSSPIVGFKVQLTPDDAKPGDTVTLQIDVTVQEGWHISPLQSGDEVGRSLLTEIEFEPRRLEAIDEAFECSIEPKEMKLKDDTQLHLGGKFSWTRQYKVKRRARSYFGKGSITFQACDDEKCLPPKTLEFSLDPDRPISVEEIASQYKLIGAPIEVLMDACDATRPKAKVSLAGVLFSPGGKPTEQLVLKGSISLNEGRNVDIYLPRDRKYKLQNKGSSNTQFENTSTYVSIDQNMDGVIDESENYASSMPIRIGGEMLKILQLDKEKESMTIQRVDVPLSGTIIGQPCPPFEYQTVDGKTVSNKSIEGKVTILDIWAVT